MSKAVYFSIVLILGSIAQLPAQPPPPYSAPPTAAVAPPANIDLEWTPPALEPLRAQAAVKSSFVFDHDMLALGPSLLPDSEAATREIVRKLDGISVHLLRFATANPPDEQAVEALRQAYHQRGWKHLVTTTSAGGPMHSGATDVWLVLNGAKIRGAVILAETPKSLALVTVAGSFDPKDLLHLRGHFGIPRFEGDRLSESK